MGRAGAWLVATIMVLASGCGTNTSTPPPTSVPATPQPSPAIGVLPGSAVNTDPQPVVDAALRAASSHLSANAADLHVDRVEPRDWPDSSLGCPQPGQLYSQIVTPGFLIVVSGGGKQLEYHADARGRVVLCKES